MTLDFSFSKDYNGFRTSGNAKAIAINSAPFLITNLLTNHYIMNIKQIYIDKEKVIESAMDDAVQTIYNSIETDPEYTLSDMEIPELIDELLKMYINNISIN